MGKFSRRAHGQSDVAAQKSEAAFREQKEAMELLFGKINQLQEDLVKAQKSWTEEKELKQTSSVQEARNQNSARCDDELDNRGKNDKRGRRK